MCFYVHVNHIEFCFLNDMQIFSAMYYSGYPLKKEGNESAIKNEGENKTVYVRELSWTDKLCHELRSLTN